MAKINFLTGCPADCDTDLTLPAIPEQQDCTSYDLLYAQISDLYIMPDGATNPLGSWSTTPTATAGAIDNTDTTNAKCKWLVGQGGIAAPTLVVGEYPKRKSKVSERVYELVFSVPNLGATMYDFLRKLQCGGTSFTFWYGDLNDFIYGKSAGIPPEYIDVRFPRTAGKDDKMAAELVLRWTADGDPERRTNPL